MVWLPEKLSQVRGDGIDKVADLVSAFIALQERAIVFERLQSQGTQALGKPGVGDIALLRQNDAAPFVDDIGYGLKIRLRKGKFKFAAARRPWC